jgi:tetratricopeptide (TPR) repeat protein
MADARRLLEGGLRYERGGAVDRALKQYEAILESTTEPSLLAAALIRIAHTRRVRCEWDEALAAARNAVTTAAGAGLDREHGEALNAEASIHHSRGELDLAASLYARILEVTDDQRVRGMALQNGGAVAAVQGDLDAAERRFAQAHEAFARAGDGSGQAHVLNSYTAVALDRKEFAVAEERAGRAIEAARAIGDLDLLGIARSNQAEALGELGRYPDAEAAATQALGHFESTGNSWLRAQCLRLLGELTERQSEPETARRFYTRALALAEEIGAEAQFDALRERLASLPGG